MQMNYLNAKVFNMRRLILIGFGLVVLFTSQAQAQEKTFHEGTETGGEGVVKYEGKPLQGQVSNAEPLEGQVSSAEVKLQAMTPKMGVLRLSPGSIKINQGWHNGCDYIVMVEKIIDAGGEQVTVKTPERRSSDSPCISYIDPGAANGLLQQGDRILAINGIGYASDRIDLSLLNQGLFQFETLVIERDGKVLKPIKLQWNVRPGHYWRTAESSQSPSEVMDAETLTRYNNWKKDGFSSNGPYAPEQYN
jgi:hypothetical protein